MNIPQIKQKASRILNGSVTYTESAKVIKPGLKHIAVKAFLGNKVDEFVKATSKGEIEKGASILRKIPKSLTNAFHDIAGALTSQKYR